MWGSCPVLIVEDTYILDQVFSRNIEMSHPIKSSQEINNSTEKIFHQTNNPENHPHHTVFTKQKYPCRVKPILKDPSRSTSSEKSVPCSTDKKTLRFQKQNNFDRGSLLTQGTESDSEKENPPSQRRQRAQLVRQQSSFTEEEILSLQEAFANLDKDGNGHLSFKELHQALGNMIAEDDINSLMEEMDVDGDGEINYQVKKSFLTIANRTNVA